MSKGKVQILTAKPYSMKNDDGSVNEGVAYVGLAYVQGFETPVQTKVQSTTLLRAGEMYQADMFLLTDKQGRAGLNILNIAPLPPQGQK